MKEMLENVSTFTSSLSQLQWNWERIWTRAQQCTWCYPEAKSVLENGVILRRDNLTLQRHYASLGIFPGTDSYPRVMYHGARTTFSLRTEEAFLDQPALVSAVPFVTLTQFFSLGSVKNLFALF